MLEVNTNKIASVESISFPAENDMTLLDAKSKNDASVKQ